MPRIFASIVAFSLFSASVVCAQPVALPNASFEAAAETASQPAGWSASSEGQTGWDKNGRNHSRAVSVRGDKADQSVYWKADNLTLQPDSLYRLSFWSKGSGHIISGLNVANHDFSSTPEWSLFRTVFVTPSQLDDAYLRLGQWNGGDWLWFDDVKLARVQPLFSRIKTAASTFLLGEGETIENQQYHFTAPLGTSNFSRPLHFTTAGFNSNRWVLGSEASIIYRHRIGDFSQSAARVRAGIGYYRGGKLIVEASRDGKLWVTIGELEKSGSVEAALPATLLPAQEIWIRLRAAAPARGAQDSSPGSFQINSYGYEATLSGAPDARGETRFLEETVTPPENLQVRVATLGALRPGSDNLARLQIATKNPQRAQLILSLQNENKPAQRVTKTLVLKAGDNTIALPYDLRSSGAYTVYLALRESAAKKPRTLYAATSDFNVPALYGADYGFRIGQLNDVWWSNAAHKISRERPLPSASSASTLIAIAAAKNEYEPFQIVARPTTDVRGLKVLAGELKTSGGARIDAKNIEICEVAYVNVAQPTDSTGVAGAWPDPLPRHTKPIDLKAGQNQPFWITVRVPKNAPAGIYRGTIQMKSATWNRAIPLQLTVRNFALTDETHVQSGFGLSSSRLSRYHNVTKPEDVARVMEKYYENFAAHRIAPYDPVFGAPIQVDWGLSSVSNWRGGEMDKSAPFAGAASLKLVDDKTNAVVAAEFNQNVPVTPGKKYTLRFVVKTAQPNQEYLVSLGTHDAAGQWISGNNLDWKRKGSGAWEEVSLEAGTRLQQSPKAAQVAAVRLALRATPWTEAGEQTGTVWFDNVQLLDENGKDLLNGGDFEPAPVAAEQVKLDFSAFDKAAQRAFEQYHFTAFRLPLQGMGSGTFHARTPGRIGIYAEGTPEYETLFASYIRQIQNHLEQKGWLDKAYVYWFDEPDPKDYDFVRDGMNRIKKYAPKIRRLLTEQPEPALFDAVNLWCPVTPQFDEKAAQQRMGAGDQFWWYICTSPKAPYATEFIDHPATELRTWLWQTWQQKVRGILVWESVFWTSEAAYPDELQNPWQDPMSWVSGYSTAAGARVPWGNGDGRFLYPPNRNPNVNKAPNFEAPVNSIRWEMLREGIEDYEYFWTLREAVRRARPRAKTVAQKAKIARAEKLLLVPDSVARTLTDFSTAPEPMLAHREKLAAAIESLQQIKP